jgi:predicted metal-dependent phosphoesterase TrpH
MKWELHLHTEETSRCAHVSAADAVAACAEKGYGGVVVTDHYSADTFDSMEGTMQERVEKWLEGYFAARAAGEKLGVRVLFGLEARVPGSVNDYLIFGAEPDFVRENPHLHEGTLAELHELCRRCNVLLVQAHPYRIGYCQPADAQDLDGVEVFNGNPRHRNANDQAEAFAAAHPHLVRTSGSDYHQTPDVDRGGIETDRDVRTSAELVQLLRDDDYRLLGRE